MSQKKHRGDHGQRAERRAERRAALKQAENAPATATRPRRVYVRDPIYISLTLLIIAGVLAVLIILGQTGLWDGVLGSILAVLIGAFGCMCIYDVGLLFSACLTFGDGVVNAGKDAQGKPMVFHANSVERLELRNKQDVPLTEERKVYRNVQLTFVMNSGRVNRRTLHRLTAKQYARLQAALDAERQYAAPETM